MSPAATAAAVRRDASRSANARSPRPPRARARSGCDRAASGVRRWPDRVAPARHAAPRRHRARAARARFRGSPAGIGGTADSPRVSALKYRPEPPMKIGSRFCARSFGQDRRRIGHPRAGGEIDRGIDMAIEPMRNARLLGGRRPRRDDPEVAIDLHGIGIDDDAAGRRRELKRQRRLAAGGRPCDKHGVACSPDANSPACLSSPR